MSTMRNKLLSLYVRATRMLCGVHKKKAVFISFNGKSYSDNPRAVSEALHAIKPDAQIVWLFHDPQNKNVPEYVQCKAANVITYYKELATASVFVDNFSMRRVPKSKKQFFIQTWHGDKAFKKVLHDSGVYPNRVLAEQLEGYCDLAIAGSDYGVRQYRSAFRYPGEILQTGTPRNDRLIQVDPQICKKTREKLGIDEGTKLLMYAPTLRHVAESNGKHQQIQNLDLSAALSLLEKQHDCQWRCLLRAHPAVASLGGASADNRIIDVSGYEDMADLLMIADMLITDYSSCAGDFALTGRPVVLYQADRQEYLEKDRTFYFDIDDSPYLVAENQDQLEQILKDLTEESAKENCRQILQFYGDTESGQASRQVAQRIKDWMER